MIVWHKCTKLFLLIAFLGGFSHTIQAQDTAVDDPSGAMTFVKTLAEETQRVWLDETLSSQEEEQAFYDIFERATDIELLSRAILGRHYRRASQDQLTAYMAVMRDYIITEFEKRMEQIGFKTLEITGTTPASGRGGHLFVRTKVERDAGEPLFASWRVRKSNDTFQIVNLEVEGVNLLITNREYFSARIADIGLDALITELEQNYARSANIEETSDLTVSQDDQA